MLPLVEIFLPVRNLICTSLLNWDELSSADTGPCAEHEKENETLGKWIHTLLFYSSLLEICHAHWQSPGGSILLLLISIISAVELNPKMQGIAI